MNLTAEEYDQLEAIKVLYPWAKFLGKNKYGDLYCYSLEPCKMSKIFWYIQYENGKNEVLREDGFPSLTWESEPLNIDEALESRECDKWIDLRCFDEQYGHAYECPDCGKGNIGIDNYCPNCGKRLEGEK